MRFSQMNRVVVPSVAIIALVLTHLPVRSQTSRTSPPTQTTRGAQTSTQQARTTAQERIDLIRVLNQRPMAEAFQSGQLPDPARLPAGDVDKQASALAKAVRNADNSSTAAFYAAILAAGYGVRDANGGVLQTTQRGQGLVMDAWQVASTAKLYGEGYGVMLAHLSEAFTRSVPSLKDEALTTAVVEGIRTAAKSDHSAVRFWARFVVEMGRNAEVPFDLLTEVNPTKTRLDAVQVAFILSRLAGDLAVVEKQQQALLIRTTGETPVGNPRGNDVVKRAMFYRTERDDFPHAQPQFVRVAMKGLGTQDGGQAPCGTSDIQDLILDYNALASTTLFGLLTKRVGGRAKTYGGVAGIANAVLMVFKFIASYAALDVELTMDADILERTKNKNPGEPRKLTAKLRIDTGKWQTINCLRPALNLAGLDVDLPKDGPLSGVNVVWVLVLGGDSRGWIGAAQDIFKILGGEASYGDGIVFFDAMPGADRSPAKQSTNKDGVSQINVVGVPQETDLSKRKLFEVHKAAGVRVDVQLKPMKIKDVKDGLSNIGDIIGNALSFLTRDPVGGGAGVVSETLYRSNWYSSKPFYFLVKDWEPCTGQWTGTITYMTALKEEGSAESFTNKQHWKNESYYEARAQLDGRKDNLGAPLARVEAHASQVRESNGTGKSECYRESKQIQEISGRGSETTTGFTISVNGRTGRYSVSAPIIVVNGSGQTTVTSAVKGTCRNPFNKDLNQTNPETNFKLDPEGPSLQGEGVIDPNNPDVITGSNTITVPTNKGGERTVTITWNLTRCKDQ